MDHKIKTTGGKGISALLKRIKNPGVVEVGIIDSKLHKKKSTSRKRKLSRTKTASLTTAEIGFVHEFGSTDGTIPERSFIRSSLTGKSRKELLALSKKLLKKIADGSMEQKQALGLLGAAGADIISQKIVTLRSPANKAATIKAKGSSNPLVDTGQLKNSITWRLPE